MRFAQKGKKAHFLAYFLRYGYFMILLTVLYGMKLLHAPRGFIVCVFGGMLFLYGVYFLLGMRFKFKHLFHAMQKVHYGHAAAFHSDWVFKKMEKEIRFTGYFFTVIGILGTVAFYFKL